MNCEITATEGIKLSSPRGCLTVQHWGKLQLGGQASFLKAAHAWGLGQV